MFSRSQRTRRAPNDVRGNFTEEESLDFLLAHGFESDTAWAIAKTGLYVTKQNRHAFTAEQLEEWDMWINTIRDFERAIFDDPEGPALDIPVPDYVITGRRRKCTGSGSGESGGRL